MQIIVSIDQNPVGFTLSLSHRGDNSRGFAKGSTKYRGLLLPELQDVLLSELSRLLGDPEQPSLFD